MNCKGNELAMIKVPRGVIGEEHNGKIVFITTLYMEGHWNYEGTLTDAHGQRYVSIADWVLYPIGNPGPEEVDETLLWKEVTKTKTEEIENV